MSKNAPVSTEVVINSYKQAAAEGLTIVELSQKLGMSKSTLNTRLTNIRGKLKAEGLTDTQVNVILPSLKRVTGPRNGSVKSLIASIAASVKETEQKETEQTENVA